MLGALRIKAVGSLVLAAILTGGCQSQQAATPPARMTSVAPLPKARRTTASPVVDTKVALPLAVNAGSWHERFSRAEADLAAGRLDEAQAAVASLDEFDLTDNPPTAEQERQRQDLELKLAAARHTAQEARRRSRR